MPSYGMEKSFVQFESDILAVSFPASRALPNLLAVRAREAEKSLT